MSAWNPPFAYGEKSPTQSPAASFNSLSPPPTIAKDLGKKWLFNGQEYKLVQATAAFTTAACAGMMMTDNGAANKTNLVGTVAANGSSRDVWAGVAALANAAVGNAISQVALNINDFFLVQTNGKAAMNAPAGTTTIHLPVVIGATAGTVSADAVTPMTPTSSALQVGIAHATVASNPVEIELFPIS